MQVYDERWKCWLFPHYKTENQNNKESIDRHASEMLKMNVETSFAASAQHCKYSESDKKYKQYNTLYIDYCLKVFLNICKGMFLNYRIKNIHGNLLKNWKQIVI